MRTIFQKVCVFVALLLVLATAGCIKRPDIEVTIDRHLAAKASVTVHIVGVAWIDRHVWATKSIADYWRPEDPLRKSAVKHEMKFGPGYPLEQLLVRDHSSWKDWEKMEARYLFVIADIPDLHTDRRLEFDREKERRKKIEIRVLPTGLKDVK